MQGHVNFQNRECQDYKKDLTQTSIDYLHWFDSYLLFWFLLREILQTFSIKYETEVEYGLNFL